MTIIFWLFESKGVELSSRDTFSSDNITFGIDFDIKGLRTSLLDFFFFFFITID